MNIKALTNGKIILKNRIVTGKALLFDEKLIGLAGPDEIPEGTEIIDCGGGCVAPGLIDVHIHGYLGRDVCDGDVGSLDVMSEGLVKNGVTGFLATTMTVSMDTVKKSLEAARKAMSRSTAELKGSRVLGVHAEGPFINPLKKGAQEERFILPPDSDFVLENDDVIKVITVAPEMDKGFRFIREVRRKTGVAVSMGHTAADYETAVAAIDAGVNHITHLYNAMTGPGSRAPGVVTAALNSDVATELIVDKYHVHPANYDHVARMLGRNLCFITDCLPAGGLPPGEYTLGGQRIIAEETLCRLTDGTIAGSVLKLNEGVMNFFRNSTLPLWECVNAASLNPARSIGLDGRKGSIEPGKDADIIVTDSDFRVKMTIIGGCIKYEA